MRPLIEDRHQRTENIVGRIPIEDRYQTDLELSQVDWENQVDISEGIINECLFFGKYITKIY